MSPMPMGMSPERRLCDKFKPCKPTRIISSSGIGPIKLLLERSKLITSCRTVLV
ncbi:hypothetical protein BT93_C2478 [Corymbia citriodora subsp. variegata]|nr:hypothetical protein BT93_C2478 [Corymbia citriodora subsp. variegata]